MQPHPLLGLHPLHLFGRRENFLVLCRLKEETFWSNSDIGKKLSGPNGVLRKEASKSFLGLVESLKESCGKDLLQDAVCLIDDHNRREVSCCSHPSSGLAVSQSKRKPLGVKQSKRVQAPRGEAEQTSASPLG